MAYFYHSTGINLIAFFMNKSIWVAVILLLLPGLLIAQTDKGNMLVALSSALGIGGDSNGFSITSSRARSDLFEGESDKTVSYNLSPRLGYFPTNRLVLGVEAYVGHTKQENALLDGDIIVREVRTTQAGVGPFARYYLPVNGFSPFVEAAVSAGSTKTAFEDFNSEISQALFRYAFGGGIAAPLGSKVSLDVLLGYSYFKTRPRDNNPDNLEFIDTVFSLGVGFSIYLDRKP